MKRTNKTTLVNLIEKDFFKNPKTQTSKNKNRYKDIS